MKREREDGWTGKGEEGQGKDQDEEREGHEAGNKVRKKERRSSFPHQEILHPPLYTEKQVTQKNKIKQ